MRIFIATALALLVYVLPARAQTVTVVNGSYDATITAGATIDIWANPAEKGAQANMVFDHWTGDTATLTDPFSAHTTLMVPSKSITVTATYKSAPAWTPTTDTIGYDDSTTPPTPITRIYYFPQAPEYTQPFLGVIFRFHGKTASASTEFDSTEYAIFNNDAVAAGFAVCALDSSDRVNKVWNTGATLSANPDLQNVVATINYFISQGWITASTPLFAEGMSDGGLMSLLAPYALSSNSGNPSPSSPSYNFRAAASYCSQSVPLLADVTLIPTIWNMAQNDDEPDVGAAGDQQAMENYENMIGRGVRSQFNLHTPTPVYPNRFWAVSTLAASDSQAIYSALKSGGFLDANDYLLEDPDNETTQLAEAIPVKYLPYSADLLLELQVCYTAHAYYDDLDNATLKFFENLATVSGVVTLPLCVNSVQPINFTFRPITGTAFTQTVTLQSNGVFNLAAIPAGSYTLAIKGTKWLQKDVSINASSGLVTGVAVTLPAGDADDNNEIDIRDFSILATAFGTSSGSSGFNAQADFNCDGVVDLKDFSLFATYFGEAGDP